MEDPTHTSRLAPEPPVSPSQLSLHVFMGDDIRTVVLRPGAQLVIGRTPPADLVLRQPSISRRHALLEWPEGPLLVRDLGSRNGTRVNGRTVVHAEVRAGDQLELGSVVAVLRNDAADPSPYLGYATFSALLDARILDAAMTGAPVSLAMLRATGHLRHLSRWIDDVRAVAPARSLIAGFGADAVLVGMPGVSASAADELLRDGLSRARARDARVVAGRVTSPLDGNSAAALLDAVLALVKTPVTGTRLKIGRERAFEEERSELLGSSPAILDVRALIRRVASSRTPVLIQGETGTGKELVARELVRNGPRAQQTFRIVHAGAIAPGVLESSLFGHERGAFTGATEAARGIFEDADGGTLLLDEVGELSKPAQAALLRVLDAGVVRRVGGLRDVRVDVRVVTATHRDLEGMVRDGEFRRDLLERLRGIVITLPPLRDRREDIPPLATAFLGEARRTHGRSVTGFSPGALDAMAAHTWPGNVRELRNVVERAVVVAEGRQVELDDLPDELRGDGADEEPEGLDFRERVRRFERRLMVDALSSTGGNKTEAAKLLRMPLRTFMHKCRAYDVDLDHGA